MKRDTSHGLSLYTAAEEMTETDPDFITAIQVCMPFDEDVAHDVSMWAISER